jgi:hypothetical protein
MHITRRKLKKSGDWQLVIFDQTIFHNLFSLYPMSRFMAYVQVHGVCFVDRYLFLISSHSSCTVLSISSVIGFSRSLFFHLRILFTPFGIFNFFFLNFKNLQILVLHYFNHVFSRLLCESIILRESDMCASNILDHWDKMCWLRHEIENKQNTWHSIFRGAFDWRIRKIE